MMRNFSAGLMLLAIAVWCLFGTASKAADSRVITISAEMTPPAWALAERALLEENANFLKIFTDKYVNPNTGYLECVETWGGADGPDDAMENYYNWPLLYVLGAPRSTLDIYNKVWNGHIDQYSKLDMLYKEFITSFDWEHSGEQYASFFMLPLCIPEDVDTQHRVVRFANFYTGRDTSARNYDPEHKIIRSIHNGSKGARLSATIEDWGGQDYWRETGDWTRVKGDVTMNLCATSLAANAYMLTGDEHYKNWLLEYVGAWRDRTIANNGIVPSNIGLNGIVGEDWDGKWYGGLMGWNWHFGGFGVLGRGVRIGFGNAYFLSGDESYLNIMRTLGAILLKNRIQTPRGLAFPNKYGDNGWHDPSNSSLFGSFYSDIYLWSLDDGDLQQLYDAETFNPRGRSGKYEEGNEIAWIKFLQGENPGFPEKALNDSFERLRSAVDGLRKDMSTGDTRRSDGPQRYSSAATAALTNLTMGGMQPLWAGALLYSQLHYFDPENRRPGLPPGVAALVHSFDKEKVNVTLVNTDQINSRDVIVQGGAYGEHQIISVEIDNKVLSVQDKCFTVRLAPGTGGKLVIYRNRFANIPSFAFPWHGDKAPLEVRVE